MRTLSRRLLRIAGIATGILAGLILLLVLFLQWNADSLANRLITAANQQFPGELLVEETELRLLRYLPNITLQLSGVRFKEDKTNDAPEVASIDRLLVAINPFKLLANELRLTALELDGGSARLILYQDSTSNIGRALGISLQPDTTQEDTLEDDPEQKPLSIEVKRLFINNFRLAAENQRSGIRLNSILERLEDRLVYNERQIDNQLSLSFQLDELADSTQTLLSNQKVELESDLLLDRKQLVATIRQGLLSLNGAGISVTGTYDLANQGDADLEFRTRNAHLDLFTLLTNQVLLLPEERIALEGQLDLSGELKGKTLGDQLPYLRVDFSTDDFRLFDKVDEKYLVQDLDSRIFFTTGRSTDLSELVMRIDTFNLEFPDGFIRGKGSFRNPAKPELSLRLLADNNMEGVQALLNPRQINGLKGRLKTDIALQIELDPQSGKYDRDFGASSIQWIDGAFNLPMSDLRADLLNVELLGKRNTFEITNLNLVRGESDFQLSGRLDNAISYFLKEPSDLKGEVRLTTRNLRLYDFIDSTLIPGISPELYNLNTRITLTAPYQALQQGKRPFTDAVLTLQRFETESNFFAKIQHISGQVRADFHQIRLDKWSGALGQSDIQFNVRLSSAKNLFNKDVRLHDLRLDYDFNSKALRAADFFTFMDQFYLPEAYREETLQNFRLKGFVEAERPDSVQYDKIPNLHFKVEDLDLRLSSFPVAFRDFTVDLVKKERNAQIGTIQGQIGKSNFRLTGEMVNFFIPPDEEPRPLTGTIRFSAGRLSTADFMDASDLLAFAPELYDLDTEVRLMIPADARTNKGLSGTWLELSNFSTRSNFIADINRIKGRITIEGRDLLLQKWEGRLGESRVNLDLALRDLPPAWSEKQPLRTISFDYRVRADRVRARDLFTFRDSFYFPEQFLEEELQDLKLAGQINASGKQGEAGSELQFRVDELNWDLTLFPVSFRDFKIDMRLQPAQALLETFAGKIGRSDFELKGRAADLNALIHEGSGTPQLEISVVSNRLDLNELMLLYLPTLQQAAATEQNRDPESAAGERPDSSDLRDFNLFALPFPEGYLDLRIDTLYFQQSTIKDISGILRTSTSRKIALEHLRSQLAGGRAELSGLLNLSDPDSALLQVEARIEEANFDRLTDPIVYGAESIVPADHFRGGFNTNATITTRLLPDLSLDVTNATGNITLSFQEGEVLDFAPLQMLSSYMGSKDLTRVRFAELENTLELEDGYVFIPKMDINSSLGAIRITGFQYFNMEMEYLVQIPFSLVTNVGWNTMTGKKRKEDAEPDEIVRMKDGGVRVNVRIEGTPDDYQIKLGKGEKFKAIEKDQKKARG